MGKHPTIVVDESTMKHMLYLQEQKTSYGGVTRTDLGVVLTDHQITLFDEDMGEAILDITVQYTPEFPSQPPMTEEDKVIRAAEILRELNTMTHREAHEDRLCVVTAVLSARGLKHQQYAQYLTGSPSIRARAHVFLNAINHIRIPKGIAQEYFDEAEHHYDQTYWYDNFYDADTRMLDYGEMVYDLVLYADGAAYAKQ